MTTEEIIGLYAPGESVPSYRQYLIQEAISEDPAAVVTPVAMFCQRRHVDLVADNDICPISNFRDEGVWFVTSTGITSPMKLAQDKALDLKRQLILTGAEATPRSR
jgi:hypothetical protein